MAHTVAVSDVITRIREMADMENTQFVTDAEILRRVNQSYRRLYNEIVNTYQDYFTEQDTITTISGTATYDLPDDFYKLVGVDVDDTGRPYSLKRLEYSQRNTRLWPTTRPYAYVIRQDAITIYPTPSAVDDLIVSYVPVPVNLVSGGNINAHNGWDQYVVEQVAIQLLAKEESSTTELREQFALTRNDLFAYFQNRDAGEPIMVRDVFDEAFGESDLLRWR